MTVEEQLTETRTKVQVNTCPGCTCPEVRELSELVDKHQPWEQEESKEITHD